jgi:sulfur carrier protein ThiS
MIHIQVILYSVLRDLFPPELHGRTEMDLPDDSTVATVVDHLGLKAPVACSVNGTIQRELHHPLQDGDLLRFFRPGAGG